jgi:hypothetical protein
LTDLVVGSEGEIGSHLLQLLRIRNFKIDGFDKKHPVDIGDEYEVVHICIPDSPNFVQIVNVYQATTKMIIIHSTVEVGTTRKIQNSTDSDVKVIYSPVRGVHHDMLECLKWFSKYYAWGEDLIEFQKRFPNCIRVEDPSKLERTKLVATTRYASDMAIQFYFERHHPHYPEFFIELNQRYGILQKYYNDHKDFGGHCILPNVEILDDDFIKRLIYGQGNLK